MNRRLVSLTLFMLIFTTLATTYSPSPNMAGIAHGFWEFIINGSTYVYSQSEPNTFQLIQGNLDAPSQFFTIIQ